MSALVLEFPSSYSELDSDEMEYIDGGGFVGFHVQIASRVLNMGAIVGGAFVAGVVGWYAKPLAALGPWGAGAAAAIAAIAGGTAGWAIKNGLKDFYVGTNISGVSYCKSIYIG